MSREFERATAMLVADETGAASRQSATADKLFAPILIGTVVSGGAAGGWQVQDLNSPERTVTVRGWVRLLIRSAAELPQDLAVGSRVIAVERSGEYLLLGRPSLYA